MNRVLIDLLMDRHKDKKTTKKRTKIKKTVISEIRSEQKKKNISTRMEEGIFLARIRSRNGSHDMHRVHNGPLKPLKCFILEKKINLVF